MIAARQGGVVSRRQLLAAGLSAKDIEYRLKVGRLRQLYRGVYAVGHDAIPIRGRLCAALLVAGPGAALSHRIAAYLLKLLPTPPPFIDLTTTKARRRDQSDLRFHHAPGLEVTRRHGLRLTTPLRTLQDLAATRPRHEVVKAVNEALVHKLATAEQIAARTGPGARVLRAIAGDAAATRSRLERRVRRGLIAAGLPAPVTDHPIGRYTADLFWPDAGVVVEVDGWGTHGHRLAFERDRVRDAELLARDVVVVRVTERMLDEDPEAAVDRVARVLSARRRRRAS